MKQQDRTFFENACFTIVLLFTAAVSIAGCVKLIEILFN